MKMAGKGLDQIKPDHACRKELRIDPALRSKSDICLLTDSGRVRNNDQCEIRKR